MDHLNPTLQIVESDAAQREAISAAARMEGFHLISTGTPDILLLSFDRGSDEALAEVREALARHPGVLLVAAPRITKTWMRQALEWGAGGCLRKPCAVPQVLEALQDAWRQICVKRELKRRIGELEEALSLEPLLQKAKGLLMAQRGYSDPQARQALERLSEENGVPLKDICLAVIRIRAVLRFSA